MAYSDILAGDSLLDSLAPLKARDDALRAFEAANSAPVSPVAYQLWIDTSTGDIKRRNAANSAWVAIGKVTDSYDGFVNARTPVLLATMDAGNNQIGNVADPSAAKDAVPRDWIFSQMAGRLVLGTKAVGWVTGPNDVLQYASGGSLVKKNSGFTISGTDSEKFSPNQDGYYLVNFSITMTSLSAIITAGLYCLTGATAGYPLAGDFLLKQTISSFAVPWTIRGGGIVRLKAGDTYQIKAAGPTVGISASADDNDLTVLFLSPDV